MQIESFMPSEIQPIWLAAGLALVVLAAFLIWRLLRRRPSSPTWAKEQTRALEVMRPSHPEFYSIMSAFRQRRRPDELFRHEDAHAAFEKILAHQARRQAAGKSASSLLDLAPAEASHGRRSLDAAALTILRTIYLDPDLFKALPAESEHQLDQYLDALATR